MGYSEDDSMVRVDFFKPSGKWYTTEAVKWTGEWKGTNNLIHGAFAQSLRDHFGDTPRLSEMDAICLEPYHEHSHPIQIKAGGWRNK
jgi:hypothetical protein